MNVQQVKIEKVKPYDKNPRKNKAAVDYVANSIKEFGFQQPIVVDKDMVVIAGHTRLKAAKKLKLKEVPVVIADNLTEEQVKAYRLADNKTAEKAEWDFDLLTDELLSLQELDFDMEQFGFDFDFGEDEEAVEDDNWEADVPEEPISKRGDIWVLGRHRLMCGDSTDAADVALLMDGNRADMLLTDPPYNVDYTGKASELETRKIENDKMEDSAFQDFLTSAFENEAENMKAGGVFYIWHADSEGLNFRVACKRAGFQVRQCLIWNKNAMVMGRQDYQWKHEPCLYGWKDGASHLWASDRKQTTVLEFEKPQKNNLHPTMKPIKLFDYQIKNNTKGDDIVLDLFGGSGTTIMAAEQNGRRGFVMEYDPKFVDVIVDRWEQFTGMKAKKIN
nr:MAG TPA: adenine specific DNA methyltransferase [Caudoviricetes sp.]